MRTLLLSAVFLFSVDAFACPMADAAAYQEARQAVQATDGAHIAFKVDGLTCGDCSTKVVDALKAVSGVHAAAVDYQTGEALVSIDASQTDADALLAVISGLGYTAVQAELQG